MIEFTRFYPEHVSKLQPQPMQRGEFSMAAITPEIAKVLSDNPSYSVWAGTDCIAAGGLLLQFEGRYLAWGLLSTSVRPHMRAITRFVRSTIVGYTKARRVEATVLSNFEPGKRWLEMLGFKNETPNGMRAYHPNGSDACLYAWVRE
jgi:hypothetical protein